VALGRWSLALVFRRQWGLPLPEYVSKKKHKGRIKANDRPRAKPLYLRCSPVDHGAAAGNNDQTCHPPRDGCAFSRFDGYTVSMKDFNRKVEDASARVNKTVAGAAERMEKETAEFIAYLNDEVVPAVRQHSTKALRVAARKMSKLADYLDEVKSDRG
jgi:hypothetical protein